MGYIAKHWRGGFSLAHAFWLNDLLVAALLSGYLEVTGDYLSAHPPIRLPTYVPLVVLPFVLMLAASVWGAVGVWRSGRAGIAAGSLASAWLARIASILVVAFFAFVALGLGSEIWDLAHGRQSERAAAAAITLKDAGHGN